MLQATIAILCGVAVYGLGIDASRAAAGDCPEVPVRHSDGAGPYDYRNPATRPDIYNIEGNHFNKDVELLRKGMSSTIAGDITYLLNKVPNHSRALLSYMNLVDRTRVDDPQGGRFGLACAFVRAKAYAPDDPSVLALYGMYLNKHGRLDEAIVEMSEASKLAPANGNIHYNLGLLYFAKRDYENARSQAKQAYDLGFPLPGLKEKLVKAGQWEK